MVLKKLYSLRKSHTDGKSQMTLQVLKSAFGKIFQVCQNEGLFQEELGYECIDHGEIQGKTVDVSLELMIRSQKDSLWPIHESIDHYNEEDVFDVIEFLHDKASFPTKGWHHDYMECGWHYTEFDAAKGKARFRNHVNGLLAHYLNGYRLNEEGEIEELPETGLGSLLDARLPPKSENIENQVNSAIRKYRLRSSTFEDRKDAVRELADAFEFIRPKLKKVMVKNDEMALFDLLNNFSIRHHNHKQKTNYDQAIWHSWMFYFFLATIHAAMREIEKKSN
ncbi:hypothetical protein [Maritalea porphyrae]|uniref:Uncharacterized protein n=1 Tax=Maritalea porphyrae TaxID=880732 RepID=A0ABQ5UVJ2_9HYPH|nr:hypothetical protein [Maritalea porphyrae]GLQ18578.1 hypothetical protein GCM10007879_28270 [Maritalea porphyrae]